MISGSRKLLNCAANTRKISVKARMNADLHMAGDLKNTGKGNLFVIFGEPDITLLPEKDGKVRVIGFARETRLTGPEVADIPTLKEQGYDVVIQGFYSLGLAKGATDEQIAYWEKVMKAAVNTDEVKKAADALDAVVEFVDSKATTKYVEEERVRMTEKLTQLGLIQ